MRYLWLTLLMVFASGSSVHLQKDSWVEFKSAEGDFTILFPSAPMKTEKLLYSDYGAFEKYTWEVKHGRDTYSVSYQDLPQIVVEKDGPRTLFNKVSKDATKLPKIKLLSDQPITLNGRPGLAYKFELINDQIQVSRAFFVGQRFYEVSVVTNKEGATGNETDLFLNSFKLVDPPTSVKQREWREYATRAGNYRLMLPGEPSTLKATRKNDAVRVDLFGVTTVDLNSNIFMAGQFDYIEPTLTDTAPEQVLNSIRDRLVAVLNARLIQESTISLQGQPGRSLLIKTDRLLDFPLPLTARVDLYLANNRRHIFISATRQENNEEVSQRFFNSIKLIETAPPAFDSEVFSAGKVGIKSPQILVKHKPRYTDEARQSKVEGTVVLSAVFTKDGTIANVRVVRGLGYGLDDEAIIAAEKIKFNPGTKDGQPVNIRARLEFTFSLL